MVYDRYACWYLHRRQTPNLNEYSLIYLVEADSFIITLPAWL